MPWCARCGTGDQPARNRHRRVCRSHPRLRFSASFRCVGREKEALLVWTTTPWTLSSNVAAAVGPELTYVKVQAPDGWTYYLAEGAMKNTLIGKENEVVGKAERRGDGRLDVSAARLTTCHGSETRLPKQATRIASSSGKTSARKKAPASSTSRRAVVRRTLVWQKSTICQWSRRSMRMASSSTGMAGKVACRCST